MLSIDVETAQILHHVIGAAASIATTLTIAIGALSGLKRYRHDLKIKSGELLLEMEKEFRAVMRTCLEIETESVYKRKIAPLLKSIENKNPLSEEELELQEDLDRCLRFFYLCTVLHTDLKIEQATVVRSYYYYASLLLDPHEKPELENYIRTNMRRLTKWLEDHKEAFSNYAETGKWNEPKRWPLKIDLRVFQRRSRLSQRI